MAAPRPLTSFPFCNTTRQLLLKCGFDNAEDLRALRPVQLAKGNIRVCVCARVYVCMYVCMCVRVCVC